MSLPSSIIIIGSITIEAGIMDDASGIKEVEFYIDNVLKKTIFNPPYEFQINESIFGRHVVKIVVYDNAGNKAVKEQTIWIFNIVF